MLLLFNSGHFQVLIQCRESLTRSCLICIPSLVFRVERLWRDVWSVTCQYYDVLNSLEEEGFIDLSIAVHLFCVGYVFIPRLRSDLQHFTELELSPLAHRGKSDTESAMDDRDAASTCVRARPGRGMFKVI